MPAHFTLLCFALLHFTDTAFITNGKSRQPCIEGLQSLSAVFLPIAFAPFASVSHLLLLTIFLFFYYYTCGGDL